MDSARHKASGEIVEAESLWYLDVVDKDGYECHGCGIALFPASYEQDINKKRPYFRRSATQPHALDCAMEGFDALVKRAKGVGVGTPEGFPVPFPNRLVLGDRRPVERNDELHGEVAVDAPPRTRAPRGAAPGGHHGHTTNTIRPMCRTFINFPHDRRSLPLTIPNCPGRSYAGVFFRLPGSEVQVFDPPRRLFYAPMRWTKPVITEEFAQWSVDAGEWDKGAKRRGTCYHVRVNWASWTTRQQNTLLHEIEVSREEVKGTDLKAWLFCVGTQSADEPTLIEVDDHRLICGLVGAMVYPR